jgi:mannose-1-phosphate guanylyltransferase
MKAFLLAAGNGTRLRPLTDSVPKCLLPVRGVPLLEIWLNNCKAAGITDVLVNTHAHAETVRKFAAAQKSGVRIRIAEEPELLGSAGTLAKNREFVSGEESFVVLYADVLTNISRNVFRQRWGSIRCPIPRDAELLPWTKMKSSRSLPRNRCGP